MQILWISLKIEQIDQVKATMLPWIQAIISFRVKPLILNCDSHARQGEAKKQPDKVTRGSFIFQNPALKVSSMNSRETMASQ